MNLLFENSISCYSLEEAAAVGALENSALWDSIVLTNRRGLIGSQWMAITIHHKPNAQANSQLNYWITAAVAFSSCEHDRIPTHSETNINTNNMFTQEKEMNSCIHDSQTLKQIHIWTHSDICTCGLIWTQWRKTHPWRFIGCSLAVNSRCLHSRRVLSSFY